VIRVGVVDDHPIVRDGVLATLADAPDVSVVGTAATVAAALELTRRERPDVLILDLELPDGNGLDAIPELKRASPATRIVVFSAYAGEERVGTALANGADSYVLKGTTSDELTATVRSVAAGGARMEASITAQALGALRAPRHLRLTDREQEILVLLADGLSNRAIGERLGIVERTVKFHVSEIFARLGAANRVQAVTIAQRRGLL